MTHTSHGGPCSKWFCGVCHSTNPGRLAGPSHVVWKWPPCRDAGTRSHSTLTLRAASHLSTVARTAAVCQTCDGRPPVAAATSWQFRNWIITCNNWTRETHETLCSLAGCKYHFQHEMGKEGTPHIQGVLMFKNARSWQQLREKIGEYYYKPANNLHACRNYCSKMKTRVGGEILHEYPGVYEAADPRSA